MNQHLSYPSAGEPRIDTTARRAALSAVLVFLLFSAATAAQQNEPALKAGQRQPEPCGLFSDLFLRFPPTHNFERTWIRIMPARYEDLEEAKEGYDRTGLDLLAYDGRRFAPAGFSDDPGIYFYIPWLSRKLHIGLAAAISLFLMMALVLSIVVAGCGVMLVLATLPGRLVGFIALFGLSFIAYRIGDIYLFEFALPMIVIPWLLHPAWRRSRTWSAGLVLLVIGLIIGVGMSIRLSAGITAFAFALVLLVSRFNTGRTRTVLFAASLFAGTVCPMLFIHHLAQPRDAFLINRVGVERQDLSRHTFWQFAYIGLGFLSNPYVPGGVCDDVGKAKVKATAPQAAYLSQRYDQVLRTEVLSVLERRPLLIVFTLAAKLGIVLLVILLFANFGLPAAIFHPKPWRIELTFLATLAASIFPVLVDAPAPQYLVGLCSVAALYGVFSIDHALQSRRAGGKQASESGHQINANRDVAQLSPV